MSQVYEIYLVPVEVQLYWVKPIVSVLLEEFTTCSKPIKLCLLQRVCISILVPLSQDILSSASSTYSQAPKDWEVNIHCNLIPVIGYYNVLPGYGTEAMRKSAYRAHLSTFSEEQTLYVCVYMFVYQN